MRAVLEKKREIQDRHQDRQDRQAQLAGGLGSWLPISDAFVRHVARLGHAHQGQRGYPG